MKKGFTLIELVIIVAIIALLAMAIMVSIEQSRKNARINSAKTSIKTVLPAVVACKYGGGIVNEPETNADVCGTNVGLDGAKWPILSYGYDYGTGIYDSDKCSFKINTGADVTKLGDTFMTCDCVRQICE